MGNVAISITVTPESPDVDFDSLKKEIEEKFEIKDMKEELIGFGLKKLKLMIIRPDKEGQGTDDLEEELSSIEGVASVNIDDVTLV
ncbi:MAG: elongation factor 1-beta [Candidatus Aenigmarchaeota archaeon]|nr:elongation factor 1-beta [Candidatus Aenigmarchaeota archaeon]